MYFHPTPNSATLLLWVSHNFIFTTITSFILLIKCFISPQTVQQIITWVTVLSNETHHIRYNWKATSLQCTMAMHWCIEALCSKASWENCPQTADYWVTCSPHMWHASCHMSAGRWWSLGLIIPLRAHCLLGWSALVLIWVSPIKWERFVAEYSTQAGTLINIHIMCNYFQIVKCLCFCEIYLYMWKIYYSYVQSVHIELYWTYFQNQGMDFPVSFNVPIHVLHFCLLRICNCKQLSSHFPHKWILFSQKHWL